MSFTPLSSALGAEVHDLDVERIGEDDAQALYRGFLEHHVLVVRNGRALSEEALIAFARCFGPVEKARKAWPLASHPEIMVISNIRENGEPMGALPDGELAFHFDRMHQKVPNKAGVLMALEVPDTGGDTLFANTCKAYETLPEATRRRIDRLTALNTYEYGRTHARGRGTSRQTNDDKKLSEETPTATHPVVRTLPESGARALYVCRLMTDRIHELAEEESRALLDELCEHLEDPRFRYAHRWRPGDILIWDNRCTIHARTDFDGAQRRLLKRVTVADTVAPQ